MYKNRYSQLYDSFVTYANVPHFNVFISSLIRVEAYLLHRKPWQSYTDFDSRLSIRKVRSVRVS